MNRFLYFAGFAYIALCAAVVGRALSPRQTANVTVAVTPPPQPAPPAQLSTGAGWFARMKPFCNQVEVDVRMRYTPPTATGEGVGFAAACYGLAGKISAARGLIEAMNPGERGVAANILFEVAHPVADAGDDRASGPMMELVLEYWPNNYMALYHAGMSEYSLGETKVAEKNLRAFLTLYNSPDGFTSAARAALAKIEAGGDGRKAVERESPARP